MNIEARYQSLGLITAMAKFTENSQLHGISNIFPMSRCLRILYFIFVEHLYLKIKLNIAFLFLIAEILQNIV